MRFETPLAAEGNPDALRNVESFHAPPDKISANIQAQLTNPQDIASANQFFKPAGTSQFLPTVGKVGPQGIEMSAVQPAAKFAAPPMTGLETQGVHLPPGGEMTALSGAPGAVPGGEPLSPLINMIMKMPGHIGLASSFFEALGAFLAPAQEMLGHLVEGFDAGALFEHAGAASETLGGVLESAGEHFSVDMHLLPADAPIFDQIGHGTGAADFAAPLHGSGHDLISGAPHLSDTFAHAPRLEVGSGPSHPIFETGPETKALSFDGANGNYLALEPSRGFGATVGNFNPPAAGATPPAPQPTASHASATPPSSGHSHGTRALDFRKEALNNSREHLIGDRATAAQSGDAHTEHSHTAAGHAGDARAAHAHGDNGHAANSHESKVHAPPAHHQEIEQSNQGVAAQGDRTSEIPSSGRGVGESFTVHKGDNLWDIARNHLGDGNRWQEIYDLNKSVLGDDPRMIMPGTQLQMPGAETIGGNTAGGVDYTVKSGDSLWNISQEHLGGGQNWHDLYQNNEGVIGGNPSVLHPGQHLQLDASSHGQAVEAGDHHPAPAAGHSHHLASQPNGPIHSHNAATIGSALTAQTQSLSGTGSE